MGQTIGEVLALAIGGASSHVPISAFGGEPTGDGIGSLRS